MARDETPPTAHEWLVVLVPGDEQDTGQTSEHEERVPAALGGVDVGMMTADHHHYVVISDADNRAVWLRRAVEVRGVKRCADPSSASTG